MFITNCGVILYSKPTVLNLLGGIINVHQSEIVTGVPAYADEKELTIGTLLKMPFTKIRKWSNNDELRNRDTSVNKKEK